MKESILRKGSQATGFKLLFLALTLLSFNGLTANRSVLTWIAYAVTAIGIAVLVIRVVCFKKYLHAKGLFLLIAFCGSYALSALLTRQYGLSETQRHSFGWRSSILYCTLMTPRPTVPRRKRNST